MSTVYVLSNESMPGLYKVGHTTRQIGRRVAELHSTSVPTSFVIEAVYQVYESELVEQTAHRLLAEHRVSNDREFFCANVDIIGAAIDDAIAIIGDQLGPRSRPLLTSEQRELREAHRRLVFVLEEVRRSKEEKEYAERLRQWKERQQFETREREEVKLQRLREREEQKEREQQEFMRLDQLKTLHHRLEILKNRRKTAFSVLSIAILAISACVFPSRALPFYAYESVMIMFGIASTFAIGALVTILWLTIRIRKSKL